MAYWPWRLGTCWPPCQVTVPFVYDESLSVLEQIGQIFCILARYNDSLEGLVTNEMFQEFVDYVKQDQIEQTAELKDYTDEEIDALRQYLEELIRQITIGSVIVVDPSTGFKYPVEEALSHSYNDLRYYAMDWDELAATWSKEEYNTWDKLDAFVNSEDLKSKGYSNIRSMDLFNRYIFNGDSLPH